MSSFFVNGKFCNYPKLAKADDFFFSGLRTPQNTSNPVVTPVNVMQIPGLNTLGMSLARIEFAPYGLNPPHTHPRRTEILVVLEGTLYVGFVTSNPENCLFTKVLYLGDVFVFPEGLIHFQFNEGKTNAVAISGLSSQNPGVITIANAVFGSNPKIYDGVLAKAFQVDKKPWCLAGDFNEIRFMSDRKGCNRRDRGMLEFNNFIDRLALLDIPLHGRKFTWCNSVKGGRWSKIDRFLLEPIWLEKYCFKLWGLPRGVSDHCPLLLMEDLRNWGPRPFKFINAWALHSNFPTVVEKCWVGSSVQGWAGYKLLRKLSLLKLELKKWNVEVFENVVNQLKKAEYDIHALDILAESRPLSSPESTIRREISNLVWKLRKRNDRIWFQKSKLNWAHNGDKNTKFFHIIASKRQSRNLLNSVLFNGIRLYLLLAEAPFLRPTCPDSIRWQRSPTGQFTVAAVRDWLAAHHGPKLLIPTLLWGNVAPPKAYFLGWLIWKGRVKTTDFLQRIGVLSSSVSNVCPFCKAERESFNHIFLLCSGIWESWNDMLLWWDMKWVTPAAVVDLLHWWRGFKYKKIARQLWNLVPMAMLWSIWKMRNDCIFNESIPNLQDLSGIVKWRVALWAKSNLSDFPYSSHDIVHNLRQILFCC
ncbi:hypothetical protein ACSBR1_040615 [Camellia fascicularis]